jgi:CHAT domain-containing protein
MAPKRIMKKKLWVYFLLLLGLMSVLATETGAQQSDFFWARNYAQKAMGAGKAKEAAKELEEWAAEAEKGKDLEKAAIFMTQASNAARFGGQLEKALVLAKRSFEISEQAQDPAQQGRSVLTIINVLDSLGQHAQKKEWLEKGLAAAKRISNPGTRETIEATLYTVIGRLRLRDGQIREAIDSILYGVRLHDSVASHIERKHAPGLLNAQVNWVTALGILGSAYERANLLDQALAAYAKGLELSQKFDLQSYSGVQTTFDLSLGNIYLRKGAYDQSERHLRVALAGAEQLRQPSALSGASSAMGNLLVQTNRPAEAIPYFGRAIEGIESTRALLSSEEFRSSFLDDKEDFYRTMIQAQLKTKNFAEAFNYNERARSRAFLDILGSRAQLSSGKVLEEEQGLRARIGALEGLLSDADAGARGQIRGDLDAAVKNYNEFLAKIRQGNKEQASLMTVEPLMLKQVQELLDPGVSLLEYFVGPLGVQLWIVEKNRIEFVELDVRREDLVAKVNALREMISQADKFDSFKRQSQELHKLLIAPALAHLRGKELLIVPHGVLHYLPFQTLVSAQGKFLIEEFPVHYLSSASLMQFTRDKRRASRESTFAMGNPNLGDEAYNLRFAEREVKEIAQINAKSTVLVRDEATKSKALSMSPKYDIVHFAVHAEFNEKDPLSSALLLAREGQDDGRLKVSEIFALNLNADLVVLSACETGLGSISSGDEIVGMTRAFIYAGTPSVIATLWKVNDRTSYELMGQFYRNLKTMSKAEALRQAQLKTMKAFPQPLYWAAYQLTGES